MEIRTRARPRLIGSTVQDVAPASVVVAARLGASRKVRGRGHNFVFGAVARWKVGFAPAHVENLKARVGVGLTTGTVRARDTRCVRKVIRHRSKTHGITPPCLYDAEGGQQVSLRRAEGALATGAHSG